jgi:two-component system, sensor histidine kinase
VIWCHVANERERHRVLVVDDDRDVVEVCCLILVADGHDCRTAMTGLTALQELEQFAPDIVFLDIRLPDMSGYEVATQIRALLGRAVYIAALTGWDGATEMAQITAAGFDERVLKPTDGAMLRAVVRNAELSLARAPG